MILRLLIIFHSFFITEQTHFNGGTITWVAVPPYNATSSVTVSITQTYSWTYPYVSCANNVPISTGRFSGANTNLTCTVDCTTDGGYSAHPVDILTDCTSASASLGMLSSTKTKSVTLSAGAHFYVAYLGTAWRALGPTNKGGAEWSILTYINLQVRPDGSINTPPVAQVISPQYAFVNQTIQIQIPVSDANAGDDVRCRWAKYTSGYRRRKRSDDEERMIYPSIVRLDSNIAENREIAHVRKKRQHHGGGGGGGGGGSSCSGSDCNHNQCDRNCDCDCDHCDNATCTGTTCNISAGCTVTASTPIIPSTSTISSTTTVTSTTTTDTTTETLGTLKSTSTYPVRQAIDECGDICFPSSGSVPNTTTLANCTLTFTGTKAGVWYAVAVQVEDFISSASTTPMSSVPAQFLIYVLPQPKCSQKPLILPVNGCLEVQVGMSVSFTLYVTNLCNRTIAVVNNMLISTDAQIYTTGNLTNSTTNSSISYVNINWIPQANEIGNLQFCVTAYTSENLASNIYCVIFTVKNSSDLCVTTTTTSTSTSSTTTSVTTSTTSTTSTSETTSTTTSTTTTSTTSSTSTSSTSTSTTSTTTSSTTTSVTTTSVTTATTVTTTAVKTSKRAINWLLIVGLSLLALLLAICCACCCLYCCLWSPGARRRRRRRSSAHTEEQHPVLTRNTIDRTRRYLPKSLSNTSLIDKTSPASDSIITNSPTDLWTKLSDSPSILTHIDQRSISSKVSVQKLKRSDIKKMNNIKRVNETKDMKDSDIGNGKDSVNQLPSVTVLRMNRLPNLDETNRRSSNGIRLQTLFNTSTKIPKATKVNIRRIGQNRTTLNERRLTASVGNMSMIGLDKSSFELGLIGGRFQSSIETTNGKVNPVSQVSVKKIPRELISVHSPS